MKSLNVIELNGKMKNDEKVGSSTEEKSNKVEGDKRSRSVYLMFKVLSSQIS